MPDIMWLALLPMGHVATWRLAVSSSITSLMHMMLRVLWLWHVWYVRHRHCLCLIVVISTTITNVALTVTITVVVRILAVIVTLILRYFGHRNIFALLVRVCPFYFEPVLIKTIDIIAKFITSFIFVFDVIDDIFCLIVLKSELVLELNFGSFNVTVEVNIGGFDRIITLSYYSIEFFPQLFVQLI